ncbi:MAG: phytanoyl-CoA dioxygenase family protein [Verrucomicrobiota bacterium]|nr:phytanoyl-CoA dioxygenase family protein [Verrucomicrobiota bacterium]MDG1892779.1 phytanoyl-CoA dioxygenase family protein [Verrucomicrobiota bacterium]
MPEKVEQMPQFFDLSGMTRLDIKHDKVMLQTMRGAFLRHGMLGLRHVFPKDLIKSLREAYFRQYSIRDKQETDELFEDVGDGDRYMFTVEMRPPFNHRLLYDSPLLFPVLQRILVEQIIIQSFGIVTSMPGSQTQHIHQDHPDLFQEMSQFSKLMPCYAITVAIPLVDFNEQTGTTAIWPGSHKNNKMVPDGKSHQCEGAVTSYPQTGDCVMWDFRTHHCGTPNLTSRERPLLYLTVSRPWFDDTYNFEKWKGRAPLVLNQEFLDSLEDKHKLLFPRATVASSA